MITFPPCKINLGLNVTEKRMDGYHNLDTCFYPVPFNDVLEIIRSEELAFESTGILIPGNAADNLCVKAYQLLKKEFDIPHVRIHLHKVIPSGAGLGGGSSDAAHTLRILNSLFSLGLGTEKLMSLAAQLGSDCAFFVQDNAMIGSGRGEVLTPCSLSLKDKFLVLVKPDIHVSTAEAYGGITPKKNSFAVKEVVEEKKMSEWRELLTNDFEETVFKKHPRIAAIKSSLYQQGASYACMSGSGSTVLGIFDSEIDLDDIGAPVIWRGLLP